MIVFFSGGVVETTADDNDVVHQTSIVTTSTIRHLVLH